MINIIKRAIVTERSTLLKEKNNQVVFEVATSATKGQIKMAVEKAFNVKVNRVNTLVIPGKFKKVGRYEGKQSSWKKAVVTLKEGSTIAVMEGV